MSEDIAEPHAEAEADAAAPAPATNGAPTRRTMLRNLKLLSPTELVALAEKLEVEGAATLRTAKSAGSCCAAATTSATAASSFARSPSSDSSR